jgi:protein SCO1/2
MIEAKFDLVDHHGQPCRANDFAGRYMLIYFGFTHCRVVCPRALAKLSAVLDEIGNLADRIDALYITVDPARDTPEVMKAHLAAIGSRFTGLTGTAAQINDAKQAFRVFAEQKPGPDDPDDYVVPHSAIAYLIDPHGLYAAHFADHLSQASISARITAIISRAEV